MARAVVEPKRRLQHQHNHSKQMMAYRKDQSRQGDLIRQQSQFCSEITQSKQQQQQRYPALGADSCCR